MARGKRDRSRSLTANAYRSIDLAPQELWLSPLPSPFPSSRINLEQVEDRRNWHPDPDAYLPRTVRSTPAKLVLRSKRIARSRNPLSLLRQINNLTFNAPKSVLRCVRRKMRRSVIIAKRKTGKGARSPKRRNHYSNIWC